MNAHYKTFITGALRVHTLLLVVKRGYSLDISNINSICIFILDDIYA